MSQDFVGAGWGFPLGVGPQGGIALVRREVELEQAMRLILATYPGERPMRPEFGSRIRDFVFRPANMETVGELSQEVRTALMRWEPRVDIDSVDVSPDPYDPATLFIDIRYRVKDTNDRRNLVFPFYSIPEDGSDY
ncbi:MAG TPA: GPW/gp25 family protein [Actinokineospora sp.]|nr:GPW/gp25 family protein [Actinokineospora sp.]